MEHLLALHTFLVDGTPVYFELYLTGGFAGVRAIEKITPSAAAARTRCCNSFLAPRRSAHSPL
eukprot:2169272-Pleurochrysis_carterae.AAC.1